MLAYLIVTGTLLLNRQHSLAEINSDGFNIYKGAYPDLLRSKSDEPYSFFEQSDSPAMYVYRAPSVLVVPEDEAGVEKRGANHFKSFMLSPQRDAELTEQEVPDKQEDQIYHFPRVVIKRAATESGGAACGWSDRAARLLARRAALLASSDSAERLNSKSAPTFAANKV